jgi:hypothetical protein
MNFSGPGGQFGATTRRLLAARADCWRHEPSLSASQRYIHSDISAVQLGESIARESQRPAIDFAHGEPFTSIHPMLYDPIEHDEFRVDIYAKILIRRTGGAAQGQVV